MSISLFRHGGKWRILLKEETLEFNEEDDFVRTLEKLLVMKVQYEPYKNE